MSAEVSTTSLYLLSIFLLDLHNAFCLGICLVCVQPEDVDFRPFKDWVLKKETELRLEVKKDSTLDIKVCAV